ncbi:uncharacterized protein LOC116474715 isoform X4 [Hylobates moloch]|uniref:uncharacterized protein LOC116474715 isoform X4 n=1 Tax=Hylobates moloch TaxID=81572 RepID=UPI00267620B6|nr:uncharacterized protein LOC116474715 isoform X4 [Hylobates moloch]
MWLHFQCVDVETEAQRGKLLEDVVHQNKRINQETGRRDPSNRVFQYSVGNRSPVVKATAARYLQWNHRSNRSSL